MRSKVFPLVGSAAAKKMLMGAWMQLGKYAAKDQWQRRWISPAEPI